tara:strand:+ start:973 stop:1845 length:873 start_codon:yes stop_codon:yes gene_type:complete
MKTKKVLVLGAYGFFGTYLCSHLNELKYDVLKHGRHSKADYLIDLTSCKEILNFLKTNKPNVIINLVALTNVDYCEKNPLEAFISNTKIVENISKSIIDCKFEIRLIHFSTDQVYNGNGSHLENIVNPINVYGITKYFGEKMISNDLNSIILRTNFVGRNYLNSNSFSDWLYKSAIDKDKITIFNDIYFNPLHILTLCNLISNHIINSKVVGTFNLGSKEGISKSEFALLFIDKLNIYSNFKIGYSSEFNFNAKRPKDMRTNVSLFENQFKLKLPNLESEIEKLYLQYNK